MADTAMIAALKARNKTAMKQTAKVLELAFVDPTELPAAVAAAVGLQLVRDGRWPPPNLSRKMDVDYNYDRNTMGNFLTGVRATMRAGNPAHSFEFDTAFIIKVLPMTIAALGAAITARAA